MGRPDVKPTGDIRTAPLPHCYVSGDPGRPLYVGLQDQLFGTRGKWNLFECTDPDCGLIWLNPMPERADIHKAYMQYFTHDSIKGDQSVEEQRSLASFLRKFRPLRQVVRYLKRGYLATSFDYTADVRALQRLGGHFLRLFPGLTRSIARDVRFIRYQLGGRLLDVGCGSGSYLSYMERLGWNTEGVEVDPRAVRQARKFSLTIHEGELEQHEFESHRFDVITLSHVLEHVHDPKRLLEECLRILKPGGTLMAITPNIRSVGHRRFKESWRGLEPPRHIHLFTCAALRRVAVEAGFRVQLRTSAVGARWLYMESTFLGRNDHLSRPLGRLALSLRARYFALYESVAVILGKDWGEVIILKGTKG